ITGESFTGPPKAGEHGLERVERGGVREHPPRALLFDHPRRAEAAPRRNRELVARHRHRRAVPETLGGSRMTALRRLVSRLASLFGARASEARIAEEIAEHLAPATDDNIARARSPEAASAVPPGSASPPRAAR